MQMLSTAVVVAVAWLALSASPVAAHPSCDACYHHCDPCCAPPSWRSEEAAPAVATASDAYHEIFGDGNSRSGPRKGRSRGGRKPSKKAPAKASPPPKAPAAASPPESEQLGK